MCCQCGGGRQQCANGATKQVWANGAWRYESCVDGEWKACGTICSENNDQGLCTGCGCAWSNDKCEAFHPEVGDCVKTAISTAEEPIGTRGTLIKDDGSSMQFHVKFAAG